MRSEKSIAFSSMGMLYLSYNGAALKRGRVLFLLIFFFLYPLSGGTRVVDTYFVNEVEVVAGSGGILLTEEEREEIKRVAGIEKLTSFQVPSSVEGTFNEAVQRLWAHGYEVTLIMKRLEGKRVILSIQVRSKSPVISSIRWEGLAHQEEDALGSILHWEVGDIFRRSQLHKVCGKIEEYFRTLGYAGVRVGCTSVLDEKNQVCLIFKINKGPIFHTEGVSFRGAGRKEKKVLSGQIPLYGREKRRSTRWGRSLWAALRRKKWDSVRAMSAACLRGKQCFSRKLLEKSLEVVRNFYRTRGFLDVKVSAKTFLKRKKGQVYVVFCVDRGAQYSIGSVKWMGNQSFGGEFLGDYLSLVPGCTYSPFEVAEKLNSASLAGGLQKLYESKGGLLLGQHFHMAGIEEHKVSLVVMLREVKAPVLRYIQVDGKGLSGDVVRGLLASHGVAGGRELRKCDLAAARNEMVACPLIDGAGVKLMPVQVHGDAVDLHCRVPLGGRAMRAGFNLDLKRGIDGSVGLQNLDLWKLLELKMPTQGCHGVAGRVFYEWGDESKGKPIIAEIGFENPFIFWRGKRYRFYCKGEYKASKDLDGGYTSGDVVVGFGDHRNEGAHRLERRLTLAGGSYHLDKLREKQDRLHCKVEMERKNVNHWFYATRGSSLKLQGDMIWVGAGVLRAIANHVRYGRYRDFVWMQEGSVGVGVAGGKCGGFFLGGGAGTIESEYLLKGGYHVPLRGYSGNCFLSNKKEGGRLFGCYTGEIRYAYSSKGYGFIFLDVGAIDLLDGGASVGVGIRQIVPFLGIVSVMVSYNSAGDFDVAFHMEHPYYF